jgi:hypothetical protein
MRQIIIKEQDKECSLKEAVFWITKEISKISDDKNKVKVVIDEENGFCDIKVIIDYD